MNLVTVSIWELAVTSFALNWNVAGVKLLNVNPQICLAAASRWTKRALKDWLLSNGMNHFMRLKRVRLCEACMADVTYKGTKMFYVVEAITVS